MINYNHALISIIIINFNGKRFLENCLRSVLTSNYTNFEVIIVDNASTDGSIELIQEKFQYNNLKIVKTGLNLGFAEGNNLGAKMAKGKYVVFLNNDTEVDKNWLKELVKVMESDKSIGAAQSKLLLFDRKTIDSAGDFINSYGYGWMRGVGEEDIGQYNETDEIFSARGAGMIVKKNILKSVDYFDSDFFMVCEDIDLCWRIRLKGYKIIFVPASIIYHFGSGTRKIFQMTSQSYYYNVRNILITLIKNTAISTMFTSVIKRTIIEVIQFLFSLPYSSKRGYNLCRLQALLWNLLNFRFVYLKRIRTQLLKNKVTPAKTTDLMIKGNSPFLSIVWRLFYNGKVDHNYFINNVIMSKNRWLS